MGRSIGSPSRAVPSVLATAFAAVAALLLLGGAATAAPPMLQLTQVGPGFSNPVYVTSTSADPPAIYVVEQGGRVWRVVDGVTDPEPFLNISSKVHFAGELGLFSIAFSPTYASDHLVYAYYVNRKVRVTVSRFKVSGTSAKETKLLTVQSRYHDHNGGQLAFGPDGKLYAATGDGGGGVIRCTAGRPRSRNSASCSVPPARRSRPGRSRASASAIPGASRSTAQRATCTSATSGR